MQQAPACPEEIALYDWDWAEACAVSWCESRWQADAINGDSLGLFQLWIGWAHYYGVPVMDLSNAHVNIAIAYLVWREQGWGPWACSPY